MAADHADIRVPPECREMIRAGALLAINTSGGKDSQAMTILLPRIVPRDQLVAVHAPLGEVEWPDTMDFIRATLPPGMPLILAPVASGKTLLDSIEERGRFPSPSNVNSYHRAECLTHVGDSQAVRSLTQCGEPMRFAMAAPIDLRNDFDSVSLRRLAKRTRDATQSRRLLALAEVYDGGSRTDASRIGGVGLQIIRDWVLRFNARGPDGLVDGKSPGAALSS